MTADLISISLGSGASVSGLWLSPPTPEACLVLAHGAGAGMSHRSMAALADGLAERSVATLRYQFLYMERGSQRPDVPAVAHAVVRAAGAEAARLAGSLPLFAGGRSFGGRMTSQAQAASPLPGVQGLVFFAFPLHPAGKPGTTRAEHLSNVSVPLLFLSGDNDALAAFDLLRSSVTALGGRATLVAQPEADHSFHVPRASGRQDTEVLAELLDEAATWMRRVAGCPSEAGAGA